MRISDLSSDVCSSDLIDWHDFDSKASQIIEAAQKGKELFVQLSHGQFGARGGSSAPCYSHVVLNPMNPYVRKDERSNVFSQAIRSISEIEIGRASFRERVCQYV